MKNLSGGDKAAGSWLPQTAIRKNEQQVTIIDEETRREARIASLEIISESLKQMNLVRDGLIKAYELESRKEINDALVNIDSSITALSQ